MSNNVMLHKIVEKNNTKIYELRPFFGEEGKEENKGEKDRRKNSIQKSETEKRRQRKKIQKNGRRKSRRINKQMNEKKTGNRRVEIKIKKLWKS